MTGVIHARSDNMIQTLTKYQHFLFHSMKKNGFRSDQATVAGKCLVASAIAAWCGFGFCRSLWVTTLWRRAASHNFCHVLHSFSPFRFQSTAPLHIEPLFVRLLLSLYNRMKIKDAMGCSVVGTHDILGNEKTCRKVKEFANILSIGHQKLACLNAGYSEEHCMNDFSCCLTYEKSTE